MSWTTRSWTLRFWGTRRRLVVKLPKAKGTNSSLSSYLNTRPVKKFSLFFFPWNTLSTACSNRFATVLHSRACDPKVHCPILPLDSSSLLEKLTMDLSTFRYTHIPLCLIIILFIFLLPHSQAKPRQAQFYDNFATYLFSERAAAAEQDNSSILIILRFNVWFKSRAWPVFICLFSDI